MSSTTTSTRGSRHEALGVAGDEAGRNARTAAARVSHRHPGQLEAHARARRDGVGVAQEQRDEGAPDVAAPEHGDPYGLVGAVTRGTARHRRRLAPVGACAICARYRPPDEPPRAPSTAQRSRRSRSSSVSRRTTTRASPSDTKTTAGRATLL